MVILSGVVAMTPTKKVAVFAAWYGSGSVHPYGDLSAVERFMRAGWCRFVICSDLILHSWSTKSGFDSQYIIDMGLEMLQLTINVDFD